MIGLKPNTYKHTYFKLGKHKCVEFQLSRWEDWPCFKADYRIRRKGKDDHHGVELILTLFWHEFSINFYDGRHKEDFTGEFPPSTEIRYGDVDILDHRN